MRRHILCVLIIGIVSAVFLPLSASSTAYALSAPACQSGNVITPDPGPSPHGALPVQPGDVVVATTIENSSGSEIVAIVFNSSFQNVNINSGPSVSTSWTATGAGTVSGGFGSQSPNGYHWSLSVNGGCSSSSSISLLNFKDGRCNQEPWQSFAVYPDGKGGYIFYAIYQGVGYYALHVTEKTLDLNPDTGANHIIAQAQGVQLWRIAGGLLQAHRIGLDGKDYSFNITCGIIEDGD